jgi:hypothetical protein
MEVNFDFPQSLQEYSWMEARMGPLLLPSVLFPVIY